jgi:hypothetical protein
MISANFSQTYPTSSSELLSRAGGETMESHELAKRLSELGKLIWQAIDGDAQITELLFELADEKLSLDKVNVAETRLDPKAAEAIIGFDLDPGVLEHERSLVPSREWEKYEVYSL